MNNQVQAITMQPGMQGGGQWMTMPAGYAGCPPGLEYLTLIDKIIIQQRKEMLEIVTGWETNNKYVLRNERGEQIYYAFEETSLCSRACCGPRRGYTIHIVDNFNKEVMKIEREFKCCAGCCWCAGIDCCAHESQVEAPPGQMVGMVKQRASGCISAFTILDASGQPIFEIDGAECCTMCGCGDKEFPIFTVDRKQVGAITKQWGGFIKEAFTDADTFGVSFPLDLDVKIKAAIMCATFLVDFMNFEKKQNNNN